MLSIVKRTLTGPLSVYLAITVLAAVLFPARALAETQLNVTYDHTHQRIDGFGASDAWSIDPIIKKWELEGKQDDIEALADLLFSIESGIGLSAWRFNIGAGSVEQGADSNI
jgi:O-glycosyl hydrolase